MLYQQPYYIFYFIYQQIIPSILSYYPLESTFCIQFHNFGSAGTENRLDT